jgi:hypothetical protein
MVSNSCLIRVNTDAHAFYLRLTCLEAGGVTKGKEEEDFTIQIVLANWESKATM